MIDSLRNVAIIAHVDHGKTTLVDKLLQQSGTFGERTAPPERVMDSNDLEKERGITILAKNTAIEWEGYHVNIVDTPGHSDFGGEVERVLSMVDSVLLLVDAVEGPMPQTRFVTRKAFDMGFRPIVVINKIDRPGSRPDWVLDQTFELFDRLGASDEQLDFPVVYASALEGYASLEAESHGTDMTPLFQAIVDHVPPPEVDPQGPFQLQVSSLDYSSYLGLIGIGRITRGIIRTNSPVKAIDTEGVVRGGRILQVFGFNGLERVEVPEARAGDIIAFTGMDELYISDTLCEPATVEPLPHLRVDEPTVSMTFQVNTSPFAGKDGKFVTSRKLGERLRDETLHNVALRVEETADPDKFKVSGRGELHLGVLIENMRREGYELGVSRPEVILRERNGELQEPYEMVTADVEETSQGAVMEKLGSRGGMLLDMLPDGRGRVRLDYRVPARGLIGFQTEFMTATSGTGILHHVFDSYDTFRKESPSSRINGALISNVAGKALGYALFNLQERGRLFIGPGESVYEGMIVGIHARDNDLVVNPTRAKQLTNVRASGTDENIILTPHIKLSLEQALETIEDDELVEITPQSIRLRKKMLSEPDRRRAARQSDTAQ
ncbi:MAG: translational GTPase TypA [Pseudomonadota bacterium]|nr:translational GTPase TypA [Pseudomonadota bacterium]